MKRISGIILLLWLFVGPLVAQQEGDYPFFKPASEFNKQRFWTVTSAATVTYTGVSVLLWEAWYKDAGIRSFHFFNDWREWERMDKFGHLFTAYNQASLGFQGLSWTGADRRKSMWAGAAIATGLQLTVELMDGFGDKWGFSLPDLAFNTLGVGLFVGQELLWQDQKIIVKVSAHPKKYPEIPVYSVDGQQSTTISARARDIFGSHYFERFIKDYNAQTIWLSFNLHSLVVQRPKSRFPKWLNLAVGYGAENMFEGTDGDYGWTSLSDDGQHIRYERDPLQLPRYQQFYLSFDIDLRRIKTRSHFLKTVFSVLNFIKIPAPALEVNTQGELKFHAFR